MPHDLTDPTIDKPVRELKPPSPPPEELPEHVARGVAFLLHRMRMRPKRPKRRGGFRPKSERQGQTT